VTERGLDGLDVAHGARSGTQNVPEDLCDMDTFFLVVTNGLEQILNMKTSPSIANNEDHSMPTLQNPRHERFAQELAAGNTADAAYVLAGYRENRSNAARLGADRDIQVRVAEIQSVGAERAAITVESLIVEAEQARSKAMSEKGGSAAAVAAITAKAKLAGLWREKVAQTDPSGENAPRYIISDRPMTEEEWIRERCGGE
jgi:hypothetical protein